MADSTKKEKIAAAKKRLKQFQQKSGRTPSSSPVPPPNPEEKNQSKQKSSTSEYIQNTELTSQPSGSIAPSLETTEISISAQTEDIQGNEKLQWFNCVRTTSSTESLQQISRQINGLLAESVDYINGEEMETSSVTELEKRNRELASLLEKYTQANEQLDTQIEQVRNHSKSLQEQLDAERISFDEKLKKDVGSLKEQLQVHIQTIGILVAEKTELQSQVNQSQRIAEQRLDEIEELSGRLKASRQRVADLERNLSTSSQSSQQHEKVLTESSREYAKDVDRLKLELYKSNKLKDEFQQQSSELTEKLNSKVSECSGLEQTVEEYKKRLEMAELYAQQMSTESESSHESVKIVEQMQLEREGLIARIHQYDESFQKVTAERDQIAEQYQHYVEQLQRQSHDLTEQVTSLTGEREKLLSQQHLLEGSVLELQRKLEDADSHQPITESRPSEVTEELQKLKTEITELQGRHEAQIRDNAQLSRFLEEKEDKINELEAKVSELGDEAGDKAMLLESVQSDKTALSRALTQNKDLKLQLAELQSGFVKLSNDNMELMTKLQGEEHSAIELAQRLAQQEDELTEIRQVMSRKDAELSELQRFVQVLKKEEYQQDQIQDRLRHYEAQAQLVDTLQNELTSAQDMMDALTTQNRELRTMLIKATDVKSNTDNSQDADSENKRDNVLDSLTSTIQQLEGERTHLIENLREQRELSDSLSVKVADLQEEVIRRTADNVENDRITRADYDSLKKAMDMIQDKYSKVMRDKAELSDKADQLEHMVTQLQGETDTIGEYISLYHHQRALLQQRESQKNEYIAHLARDREEMQGKLGQLQALVMQLLGERNMLHSYNEEATRPTSPDVTIQPHLSHVRGHGHSHPHKHHHHHHMTNGMTNNSYNDWPDYTSSESDSESEVEPIVGGADPGPEPATPTENVTPESSPEQVNENVHIHRTVSEDDQTAHRILNLLSEIGHSNLVEKPPFMERNFLPCKYCTGPIHVV